MDSIEIKKRIIKDATSYTAVSYTAHVLDFIYGILIGRYLGPYLIGIWNMLKVVLSYCNYNTLGTSAATGYKIPFFNGKGQADDVEEIQNTFFSFSLLSSIILSILISIAAIVLHDKYSKEVVIGIYVIGLYMVFWNVYSAYLILARAYKNFTAVNIVILFDSAVNLVLAYFLIRHFKLYGLYISVLVLSILNVLLIRLLTKFKIKFQIKWSRLRELMAYGFPIFIAGILGNVLYSTDRIMIAKMLGITYVGYYSIGIMARQYVHEAAQTFGTVTMPHMMESYGNTNNFEAIQRFVLRSTETIAFLLPPLLGAIFILCPVMISLLLPKFSPGILAMQILLVDIFFRCCNPQVKHFLVAQGKQAKFVPITAAAICLNIVLNYLLIKCGFGIYGVASATAITSYLTFIVLFFYALFGLISLKAFYLSLIKIHLPLVYIVSVILISQRFLTTSNLFLKTAISLLVVLVFSLPLFYSVNKKTGALNIILHWLKEKLKGVN